jgi:hypothetical protein
MDILFIWTGSKIPLYEWRTRCIRRAVEIYPEANFKVITTLKGFFNMEIIDAVELNKEMAEYKLDVHSGVMFSDYARYYWLSKNPNTLYIDTDVWCVKPMPEIEGSGNCNYWMIWNGNNTEIMKELLDTHDYRGSLVHTVVPLSQAGVQMGEYFEHKPVLSIKD